jgi:hypothetical protein
MSELTHKEKTSLITIVIVLSFLMLGFHYETIIQGILPDYSIEPSDTHNQCKISGLNDYIGTYHDLS